MEKLFFVMKGGTVTGTTWRAQRVRTLRSREATRDSAL
jgi:hypothetical protein